MSTHTAHLASPVAPALLRALAEPLRWRIVEALAAEELCVCHLAADLGVDQPSVSHHLRMLREVGLVESERHRYWTYYRLAPAHLASLAGRLGDLAARAPAPRTARRPCG